MGGINTDCGCDNMGAAYFGCGLLFTYLVRISPNAAHDSMLSPVPSRRRHRTRSFTASASAFFLLPISFRSSSSFSSSSIPTAEGSSAAWSASRSRSRSRTRTRRSINARSRTGRLSRSGPWGPGPLRTGVGDWVASRRHGRGWADGEADAASTGALRRTRRKGGRTPWIAFSGSVGDSATRRSSSSVETWRLLRGLRQQAGREMIQHGMVCTGDTCAGVAWGEWAVACWRVDASRAEAQQQSVTTAEARDCSLCDVRRLKSWAPADSVAACARAVSLDVEAVRCCAGSSQQLPQRICGGKASQQLHSSTARPEVLRHTA